MGSTTSASAGEVDPSMSAAASAKEMNRTADPGAGRPEIDTAATHVPNGDAAAGQSIAVGSEGNAASPAAPTKPRSDDASSSSGSDAAASSSSSPSALASVPSRPSKKESKSELLARCAALGLDTRGKRETLFDRLLKNYTRVQDEAAALAKAEQLKRRPRQVRQPYASYLCFDVEGTCEPSTNFDYPNEIIEFPVVLLQWVNDEDQEDDATDLRADGTPHPPRRHLAIIDTFHTYVRPTWRPVLSDFCVRLTGITQATVDAAPTFPEVLARLEAWLDQHGLRDAEREGLRGDVVWVTDGPWDLRDFIPKQLHITPIGSPPRYPPYLLGDYLNLKRAVSTVLGECADADAAAAAAAAATQGATQPTPPRRITTGMRRQFHREAPSSYLNITGQLAALGLGTFSGRQHSGVDDATNMARILIEVARRNVVIEANARLPPARNAKTWPWMGARPGEVVWRRPMGAGVTRDGVIGGAAGEEETSGVSHAAPAAEEGDRNQKAAPTHVSADPTASLSEADKTREDGTAESAAECSVLLSVDTPTPTQTQPSLPNPPGTGSKKTVMRTAQKKRQKARRRAEAEAAAEAEAETEAEAEAAEAGAKADTDADAHAKFLDLVKTANAMDQEIKDIAARMTAMKMSAHRD